MSRHDAVQEYSNAEKEIIEVERRMVERAERIGRQWQNLRETTARRCALPAVGVAALIGGLLAFAALRRNRLPTRPPPRLRFGRNLPAQETSLLAKVIALASLVGTLQKLPRAIAPLAGLVRGVRDTPRRTFTDIRTGERPMPAPGRPR